jgi:Lon protease-like protein
MIGKCLQDNSPFGVIYAHDGNVERVGCSAVISQVIRRYADGRIDLVAQGRDRFQVVFFDDSEPCLRASVDLLLDSADDKEPSEARVKQAFDLFEQACKLSDVEEGKELDHGWSHSGLAFRLASALQLHNSVRQRILEAPSEDARLRELTECLSELVPRLAERQNAAKLAGSNGRFRRQEPAGA